MFLTMIASRRAFSTTAARSFLSKFSKYVVDANPGEFVVKPLVKPVGLVTPPTSTTVYSMGNSFKELFDKEKTEKRSEELGLEFNKSGMYDMFIFRKTNGKLFKSPKSYWKAEKALYFPHIVGDSVKGKTENVEDLLKGKLSVVQVFTSEIGNELASTSLKSESQDLDYLGKDFKILEMLNSQIVHLNLIDSKLKSILFKTFSMSKLRNSIPEYLQSTYLLCDRSQLPFAVRELLNINNVYTGFTMLVDPNLKIRWMCSGSATEDEFKTLWKNVRGISKEFTESK